MVTVLESRERARINSPDPKGNSPRSQEGPISQESTNLRMTEALKHILPFFSPLRIPDVSKKEIERSPSPFSDVGSVSLLSPTSEKSTLRPGRLGKEKGIQACPDGKVVHGKEVQVEVECSPFLDDVSPRNAELRQQRSTSPVLNSSPKSPWLANTAVSPPSTPPASTKSETTSAPLRPLSVPFSSCPDGTVDLPHPTVQPAFPTYASAEAASTKVSSTPQMYQRLTVRAGLADSDISMLKRFMLVSGMSISSSRTVLALSNWKLEDALALSLLPPKSAEASNFASLSALETCLGSSWKDTHLPLLSPEFLPPATPPPPTAYSRKHLVLPPLDCGVASVPIASSSSAAPATRCNLVAYLAAGRYREALNMLSDRVIFLNSQLGLGHSATLVALQLYGEACWGYGYGEGARWALSVSVTARVLALGRAHPDALLSLFTFANFLGENGHWEGDGAAEGESLNQEDLGKVDVSVSNDGAAAAAGGTSTKFRRAAPPIGCAGLLGDTLTLARQALEGLGLSLGARHPSYLHAAEGYVDLLRMAGGSLSEAACLQRAVTQTWCDLLGPDHPHALLSLYAFSSLLDYEFPSQHRKEAQRLLGAFISLGKYCRDYNNCGVVEGGGPKDGLGKDGGTTLSRDTSPALFASRTLVVSKYMRITGTEDPLVAAEKVIFQHWNLSSAIDCFLNFRDRH